jgi:hypothetical protein
LCAVVVACIALGCADDVAPSDATPHRAPASAEFKLRGFDYTQKEGETITYSLQAAEFLWRKRRFGVFAVAPFREVAMKNAKLSVRFRPDQEFSVPAIRRDQSATEPDFLPGFGAVTRMTADLLVVEISDDAGVLLRLRAERGRFSSRFDVDLRTNVMVTSRGGQRIEAGRASWDGGRLAIPGRYTLETRAGTKSGVNALFALEASGLLRSARASRSSAIH